MMLGKLQNLILVYLLGHLVDATIVFEHIMLGVDIDNLNRFMYYVLAF
jgi:hypothetical protein